MTNTFKRLFETYNYSSLSAHLEKLGWRNDGDIRHVQTVWHRPELGFEHSEILLPYQKDTKDLESALQRLVQELSIFYDKEIETVISELLGIANDKLNVRLVSDKTRDGKIPLEEGINLVDSSRELLLAAFLSTHRHKKNYPGQRPDFVTDFLKKVELGQTEEGSFIINLYIPNNLEPEENLTLGLEDSFSRRSVQLLGQAIESLNSKILDFSLSDDIHVFDQTVEKGVSANLCNALIRMSSDGSSQVEFSISENNGLEKPIVRTTCVVETSTIPIIKKVAEYFKEEIESPGTIIIGHVAVLHQEENAIEGDITLSTVFGVGYKRVRITLGQEHYARAIEAHSKRMPLACTGTLIQGDRRTTMIEVKNVELVADKE